MVMGLLFSLFVPSARPQEESVATHEEGHPDAALLSFDDLRTLSSTAKPEEGLQARLDTVLTTPFVHNDAGAAAVRPHRPITQGLGPVLRVATWNIERGLNFELIRSALTDANEFEKFENDSKHLTGFHKELVRSQLNTLENADVFILNEVDLGMKRTEYRDVAHDLAVALHMNYAYGVEFVEVDPVFALGTEQVHLPDGQQDQRLQEDLQVDRELYRGLHGTAILSRYPIRNARIVRLPVCYDWYSKEAKEVAHIEKGKRWAAHRLFKERISREIRRGGRMALIVELAIPDLPTGEATIVATHLENRCAPGCRVRQMNAVLASVKQTQNPVVLAGDLNTTGRNNTPTSVRDEIMSRVTDYQFWIGQTVSYFHPLGIYRHALFPVHYLHGYNDPTAYHIPILWNNRERALFNTVEDFRFAYERAFDFSGEPERTLRGRSRTLADSNERAAKGFIPTYSFARDYGGLVGRFKLDWILVKPFVQNPRRNGQSGLFAPYFPETMRALNESVNDRICDHAPMTVDLPLKEPMQQ